MAPVISLAGPARPARLEMGCEPSQLALAWLLAQGDDIVPIPGTKRRTYLEESVAALAVELTKEDLARIEERAPKDIAQAAGTRKQASIG